MTAGLAIVLLGWLGLCSAAQAASSSRSVPAAVQSFAGCLAGQKSGDLLLLIDESGSLAKTDPRAARVSAARYLVDSLAPIAQRSAVKLSVGVAAFADKYRPVRNWTTLSRTATAGLDRSIGTLADRDKGYETDYWTAVDGARKALEERADENPDRCQAMVLFTDGELSLSARKTSQQRDRYGETKPYSGGLKLTRESAVRQAVKDARRDLCRSGGLADSIRADGITTFAVGLQGSQPQNFGLLSALATGQGPGGTTCGSITSPSPGTFQTAKDIDSLLFSFDSLLLDAPVITREPVCQGSGRACARDAHTFVLDRSIDTVHILAGSSVSTAQVVLGRPSGADVNLTNAGVGKQSTVSGTNGNITYTWQSARTLEVDLVRPPGAVGWTGQWGITFIDPAASSPNALSTSNIHVSGDITAAWPEAQQTTLHAEETVRGVKIGLATSNGAAVDPRSLLGQANLSVALLDSRGTKVRDVAKNLSKTEIGQPLSLNLSGVKPGTAQLRLTLAITTAAARVGNQVVRGTTLTPAVTDIPLRIQSPLNYPKVTQTVDVGTITGVTKANKSITVSGPGCVWLDPASEVKILSAPEEIGQVAISSKASSRSSCVKISGSKQVSLPIVIANKAQANGDLKATVVVSTAPLGGAGKQVDVDVRVDGEYEKAVDQEKFLLTLILALLLGPGVPAVLVAIGKWFEARIPAGTLAFERFVVEVRSGEVLRGGRPLALDDRDFVHNQVQIDGGTSRRVTVAGAVIRTKLTLLPGSPCYAVVEAPGLVGASDQARATTKRGLRARLPLAVHQHWVVLHDPTGPETNAELLFLVSGDADRATRAQLVQDARQKAPGVLSRLRAQAEQAGLTGAANPQGPGPDPGSGGGGPWGGGPGPTGGPGGGPGGGFSNPVPSGAPAGSGPWSSPPPARPPGGFS